MAYRSPRSGTSPAKKSAAASAPVPDTPTPLRLGAALLFGCGVGVLATPLDRTIQVVVLVACLGAGLLWIFGHPYRRDIRLAVESRGGRYTTRVSQLVPLLPLWLALMIIPGLGLDNWFAALGVTAVAAAYSWIVLPSMDGTRAVARL